MSDGRYHTVELLSQKKNFTLRVDQGNARSMINEGEHEYLRLSTQALLAEKTAAREAAEKAARQWQLRNTTSFRVCIKGFDCFFLSFFLALFHFVSIVNKSCFHVCRIMDQW